MIKFARTLHTDGTGYWSNHKTAVRTTALELRKLNQNFGELRVHFDTNTWSIRKFGLIYTDKLWLEELKAELAKLNIAVDDVDYSEQGMQATEYVSLDVKGKFIRDFEALTTVTV